jgi:hypothetical protein
MVAPVNWNTRADARQEARQLPTYLPAKSLILNAARLRGIAAIVRLRFPVFANDANLSAISR